ncbi:MAG: serA4 [Verrucomicrobia bacterium]|nr:serA4 [Verrucomicrobiota bacterium]
MKILHIALTQPNSRLFTPYFRAQVSALGEFSCIENGGALSEYERTALIREHDALLTGWGSIPVPAALAEDPGKLRYICHLTGSIGGIIPPEIVGAGLPVTNWGDAPAFPVAEGALALLLACLKQLPDHLNVKRAGGWRPEHEAWIGSMRELRLGLYGYGAIGRTFHELCRPMNPRVTVYDPYVADLPPDVARAASVKALFEGSDAVTVHAALTTETHGSITREVLACLPEGGIVINTARGGIVDQDALFAELAAGRLRAGLDVLAGDDRLPGDHVARTWSNLILTGHIVHYVHWPHGPARLDLWHNVALENLRRFKSGEPLRFRLTEEQLARST